jgi:hypothetical protein
LTVEHVGLAARYVLDVVGVDQINLETANFEDFEEGDPVDAGRFHSHGVHAVLHQPVGQPL